MAITSRGHFTNLIIILQVKKLMVAIDDIDRCKTTKSMCIGRNSETEWIAEYRQFPSNVVGQRGSREEIFSRSNPSSPILERLFSQFRKNLKTNIKKSKIYISHRVISFIAHVYILANSQNSINETPLGEHISGNFRSIRTKSSLKNVFP